MAAGYFAMNDEQICSNGVQCVRLREQLFLYARWQEATWLARAA